MLKDIENRINLMFPQLRNEAPAETEGNTLGSTEELWSKLSDKFVAKTKKILAPLGSVILDVKTDLQVTNPDAAPVVQVEVVDSVGAALVDTADWDKTAITNHYEDVKLHRISRPFSLTSYDLMRGERVESKIAAAVDVVAQGVVKQFADAIASVEETNISDFGPAAAAEMSGAFESAETESMILSPALYAKLIPTNTLGFEPAEQGAYGINHIYKGVGTGDCVVMSASAVAGAIATPAVLENHGGNGMDIRVIGSVAGFPLILKTQYDWNETLKCSVECFAGFKAINPSEIKRFKLTA